jgi:hypothetical protein
VPDEQPVRLALVGGHLQGLAEALLRAREALRGGRRAGRPSAAGRLHAPVAREQRDPGAAEQQPEHERERHRDQPRGLQLGPAPALEDRLVVVVGREEAVERPPPRAGAGVHHRGQALRGRLEGRLRAVLPVVLGRLLDREQAQLALTPGGQLARMRELGVDAHVGLHVALQPVGLARRRVREQVALAREHVDARLLGGAHLAVVALRAAALDAGGVEHGAGHDEHARDGGGEDAHS